ncbi:alpha/beta hydrolase [Nocardioides sediminis]|uniref:alpha/beta hydrolase n=1 Tax=Nocardioides sediminis TaxID=433648 RepID=UPI000D2FBBC7|nr:alpha/beta fold hydrolase [Nocardioides sediminis]
MDGAAWATAGGNARPMTGVLALGAGLLVLAVGVGLGPRHLAVEGLGPTGVLGLVLAACGVAAVLWGAVRVLRGTRRRWWVLTVPLLLVATYLSLWTLGTAVAAAFPPRPDLGSRTPADLAMAYEEVTLPSADGVQLSGWYVESRNGAAVALLHGAGSTRTSVLDHAAVLAGHGYGVLLLDARGHGESEGRGMDLGWWGESDAAGAVDFLSRRPDVSPGRIGLVGLSMGGEEAIGAAGVDERVAAVVAEGATNRTAADRGYLAAYGFRGEVQQAIDRVTTALVGVLTPAPRPSSLRQSVATATGRTEPTAFLLLAAGEVPDESLAVDYVSGTARGQVETWTVPGAGHTGGLSAEPEEWEERVVTFLDASLGPSGP